MIKRTLQDAKQQLGWQGICGIALLALAGAIHWLSIAPLEKQTSNMHSRLDAAHSKASNHGGAISMGDRQKELGAFYQSLPDEKDVTDIMAVIYASAGTYGVELKEASYHMDEKDKPRIEYVMDFPMRGEYARIRLLVSHILAKHPYLALDQIDFKRDHISNATLQANVRMTLFLRPAK